MTLHRRRLVQSIGALAAASALPQAARAQSYPSRPVKLVVGYAPGGATDITARLIGQWLSEKLKQAFVVENRPGVATNIATEAVINSPPDGYTLLMASAANAINAEMYEKLKFNFVRDTAAVAGVIRMQNVLVVHPDVPARNVAELIQYAKANPDKLTYASPGIGSPGHVSAELFKMMTGAPLTHLPYRGVAPALTDLLSGRIKVMVDNMATALPNITAGKVRALGVTTAARSTLLPNLPTVAEGVPGYEASSWFGVVAPKDTPRLAVETLNVEINRALADPSIAVRFGTLGGTPLPGSPADFSRMIAQETEKWAKVVRFAGAKVN
ncbi:MAG: tripartite tricarboxylate transporter substrate binding protein [Alphaproteobacteria bacterium]|nr:tripartite tricarboxylate transporter substrate binding protein [Alphaproteobacteria bacterium]